jgi:hypothetical protein
MTASTCGAVSFDTRLIVREGSTNSSCSALTCAGAYLVSSVSLDYVMHSHFVANVDSCSMPATGSNDDAGCGGGSSVTWNSLLNATYHIQVTGSDQSVAGDYFLQVDGVRPGQTLVESVSPGKKRNRQGNTSSQLGDISHAALVPQSASPHPSRMQRATQLVRRTPSRIQGLVQMRMNL